MPTATPVDYSTTLPIWDGPPPIMSSFMEQRRTRRFTLQLPLSITPAGRDRAPFTGVTNNISSSGVLFTAGQEPEIGTPIEYIVTLNASLGEPVHLRCVGKVLRAEPVLGAYQVAATLERYEFVRSR